VYHGNNVRHPLYPRTAGQTRTLTYVMSSCSTNLKPKCQLTLNLDPGWECPSLLSEENKKKRERKDKVPNQKSEENKRKKIPDQGLEEKQKKYEKRSLDQITSEQYRVVTKCRNLPFGGRATRDSRDACSTKGIRAESPPTFIWGKRRKNRTRRDLRTFKWKVRELYLRTGKVLAPHTSVPRDGSL